MLMSTATRRAAAARGPRKLVISTPWPSTAGWRMATGGLLPAGPGPRGALRFDQWLTRTTAAGVLPADRRD
jgi:hypothetical protein